MADLNAALINNPTREADTMPIRENDFWDEDVIIKDLLFETNLPVSAIAKELGWTQVQTAKRIKQLGLGWVRRKNRKLSRGHAALTDIMRRLLPGEEIVNEHHIGQRLMLDIYCPSYSLAAEYHGRQHFFYSNLFHSDRQAFEESKRRDEKKIELCKQEGIALVVFSFSEKLDEDYVFAKLLQGLKDAPPPKEEEKKSIKDNPYYLKMKQRDRDYRKEVYRRRKRNGNK